MKVTLESRDRERLVELMAGWADGIDAPDEPLFGFAGSSELLSPRQLVRAVQDETEIGKRYVQDLAEVVAKAAFEDVARKTFR
jgi:hypothetical protein